MKRPLIIIALIIASLGTAKGQKFEFGIQYIPLELSKVTFDQESFIFNDYTSVKISDPVYRLSVPSLSNAGFFVRWNRKNISLQSGLSFHNNVYFYSHKGTYSMSTFMSFFYSSLDLPVTFSYTVFPDNKLKFRLTGGVNSKMFRMRRNYYSVFTKNFDYFNYAEESSADREKRRFMIGQVSPFIVYSRFGFGIKYYNITADLFFDGSITSSDRKIDRYNANLKDTYQINLALGFSIPSKDLAYRKSGGKISK